MKPPKVWFSEKSIRSECLDFEENFIPFVVEVQKDARAKLLARIAELEDTIRMRIADDDVYRSYGRNTTAIAVLDDIKARRGPEWSGAKIKYPRKRQV